MLNNSPVFEKLLEIHNISFDAGKKLSKKIISRYTSIDKYGELAISFADKFYETPITIDKNFLRDELRYKWSRLGNYDNLFGDLIDLMIDELGFEYDCSLFPAKHDYGGFTSYGKPEPAILKLENGKKLKEFPMNIHYILGKNVVFSGGGFFRFYPYRLIKYWTSRSSYLMTYFHPRDFDPDQPVIKSLPLMRKFKSYVGLSASFGKFQKLLNDFEFLSVREANKSIDWEKARVIELNSSNDK